MRRHLSRALFCAVAAMVQLDSAIHEQVRSCMESGKKSGAVVSAWEKICGILEGAGLSWFGELLPQHVVVDNRNRDNLLIDPASAHHLGANIVRQGWSSEKARFSTCIQLPTCPVKRQDVLDKNTRTFRCLPVFALVVHIYKYIYMCVYIHRSVKS